MPAGTANPRITTLRIASISIARYMASRTRASANGFLPLTSEVRSSFTPVSRPRKMVRICGVWTIFSLALRLIRFRSWNGGSSTKSTWPDSSAATRVAAFLTGV